MIRSESVIFSSLALVLALTLAGVGRKVAGRLGAPFVMACAVACLLFAGSRESATYGDAAEVRRHITVYGLLLRLVFLFALVTALRAAAARDGRGGAGGAWAGPHGRG
jgi:hypothetical protein